MKLPKKLKFLKSFGPGFITGASDDDPSGIATYAQTGAIFGYAQSWLALFSFPLMYATQEMCARIGLVTGRGLSGIIKKHYSAVILFPIVSLLLLANTINIGADLGAMAQSLNDILPIGQNLLLILIVIATILMEIFIPYRLYAKLLSILGLTLLAYVVTAIIAVDNWVEVVRSLFIPKIAFDQVYLMNIVAVLGTTISPYLFFWQANEEIEEEIIEHKLLRMNFGKPKITYRDMHRMREDTRMGMVFSQLMMLAIIITTGATLHKAGITNIDTPAQASQALTPLTGRFSSLLFTLGILGTGFLAIPVLAGSASYALSEMIGLKEGLGKKYSQAHGFYGIIALSTIVGMLMNLFLDNPYKFLYYAAVVNGIIAPILLVIIIMIANNKAILGKNTNSKWSNILGTTTIIVMSLAAILLIINLLT